MSDDGGVMSSQGTVHVPPKTVTPDLGKGALDTWRSQRIVRRSDAVPTISRRNEGLGCGQTIKAGVYASQRLSLAKLGRPAEDRPRSRTGPGRSGRPGLLGGLRKRDHGGNVNPHRNRKGDAGNPPPTVGAPELYPNGAADKAANLVG